ncbi:iron-containing alcohol dehydrogenase [Draconibacterium sp. IB214405]|uniref:iron-containing alcohol dehydrogenase n=1 Tax=Draconibacterium sp. IB214405 TaxID=3097352 RepID=UPI002A17583E|nr:iron-containing alcohol dehydrogenase [Draconibacterium sp. IB214405]MDX8340213.1 iron-containing alcohol dehydrogenase [Draconibacterium sp. IB214405]
MYNFEYKNPVKILFGKESISKLAGEIPENATILMTYGGGSIKNTGVYDQVMEALKGCNITEFGGIEANPHYETCMKAVEVVKEKEVDFLLAVGGGSVLDATKFIAAAVLYENGDPWDILAAGAPVEKAIPLGAVLTLPATGSEMNGNSVITRAERQEKKAFGSSLVMPQFSVLDPECVFTLPDKQVANGVVDAFVHVMEQYLTYNVNSPLQDRLAESILTTLVEEGPKVLADRKDYDAAANFMWCATMALNGMIAVGVPQDWSTHLIGHELTAFHGIDHGRTLAIVLPGVMHIKRENKKDKILQYGERIWGITEGSADEKIDAIIARTVKFFESLGVPCTLPEYGVPESSIDKIVDRFKQSEAQIGEKGDMNYLEIEQILKNRL